MLKRFLTRLHSAPRRLALAALPTMSLCVLASAVAAQATSWSNVPIGGGGRTVGIIGSPNSEMLYLRTDVGGAFKRGPGDKEWVPMTSTFTPDYDTRMRGSAGLGVHPTDGDVLYSAFERGVYKSEDQGYTWDQSLALNVITNGSPGDREDRNYGEALVVDQRDGDVVYYGSHRDGLWYTRDAGASWKQIPRGQLPFTKTNSDRGSRCVVVDNLRATVNGRAKFVYVSVKNLGLYRSTDGGTSFSRWTPVLPGGGKYVRWLRQSRQGDLYAAHEKGLARWDGTTWRDVSPVAGREVTTVATDPQNDARLLCFAYDAGSKTGDMYRSTNRGASWQKIVSEIGYIPTWAKGRFEPGKDLTFSIYFDDQSAGANNTAYVLSNYAPWRTTNVWAPVVKWDAFIDGDEMTINIAGASLPAGGSPYIAGMADIRGFRFDDVDQYADSRLVIRRQDVVAGFGSPNMTGIDFAESDPDEVWFTSSRRISASARDEPTAHVAAVYRSSDGGRTLRYVSNPAAGTAFARDCGGPKIAVSATDSKRAVAMTRSVVRYTDDGGETWNNAAGLNGNGHLLEREIEYEFDQLLASDRVDGSTFYAYATDGTFLRSVNGGATFRAVASAKLPARTFKLGGYTPNSSTGGGVHMAAAPGLKGELWLALGASGIWRSSGTGAQKTNAFTEVKYFARTNPTAVTFGVPRPGTTTPTVYVYGQRAADRQWGIWRSDDLGANWKLHTPADNPGQWPRLLVADRQAYGRVYMGDASRGIRKVTFDKPVVAAGGDDVAAVSTPALVSPGADIAVSVTYTAAARRDLVVVFQRNRDPYTEFAVARRKVPPGSRSQTISLAIPDDVPAGDDYQIQVFLTPPGLSWPARVANLNTTPLTVLGASASTASGIGVLKWVSAPAAVIAGEAVTVPVTYEVSEARDLVVVLQTSAAPHTNHVVTRRRLDPTAEYAVVELSVPAGVPPGLGAYQLQVFITAIGGGWPGRVANDLTEGIDVLPRNSNYPNSVAVARVPKSIPAGSPTWVSVDYSAAEATELHVVLQREGTPGINYGRKTRLLPRGARRIDLELDVDGEAPAATGEYRVRAFLAPPGKTYGDRVATDVATGLDLTAALDSRGAGASLAVYDDAVGAGWRVLARDGFDDQQVGRPAAGAFAYRFASGVRGGYATFLAERGIDLAQVDRLEFYARAGTGQRFPLSLRSAGTSQGTGLQVEGFAADLTEEYLKFSVAPTDLPTPDRLRAVTFDVPPGNELYLDRVRFVYADGAARPLTNDELATLAASTGSVQPNPSSGYVTAEFYAAPGHAQATVELRALDGRTLVSRSAAVTEGRNRVELNFESDVPRGMYILFSADPEGVTRLAQPVIIQ